MRVLTVFGTRPEAIKLAPVVAELLSRRGTFDPIVAVTGQHREILDQVLSLFELRPDYDLDIMQAGQSLTDVTTRALRGLSPVIEQSRPDLVMVQGDTTTTFVAALAAFYHRVPVAHVEAGLRTHDLMRPYPEEGNRQMTSRLSRWHFAATRGARENLLAEGIDPSDVHVTGNTVVDALQAVRTRPYAFPPGRLSTALASGRRIILVTSHRRENWGDPLRRICDAIATLVDTFDDIQVLFATHPNPIVTDTAHQLLDKLDRVLLIGSQEYLAFVKLMDAATLILSDSGGIQEEAPALGVPTLVLRDVTERPEAIESGVARLVGTDSGRIVQEVSRLLTDEAAYATMACASNPFGDGNAAVRIADLLAAGVEAKHECAP